MRISILVFLLFFSVSSLAQNREEIIKKLEFVFHEHSETNSLKTVEVFYNPLEHILDIGERYDLDQVILTYEFAGSASDPIHMLKFDKNTSPGSATSYFFDTKKSVYDVLNLIYLLKNTD